MGWFVVHPFGRARSIGEIEMKVCLLVLFATLLAPLQGATAALVTTLNPTQDTRIISDPGTANSTNLTAHTLRSLSVHNIGANVQRSLLQFSLTSIPAGSVIESATLTLFANLQGSNGGWFTTSGGNATNIHRVLVPWTDSQTTWNNRQTGDLWTQPGALGTDVADSFASTTANPADQQSITFDLTSLAQSWLNSPSTNFGVMLSGAPGNGLHFFSNDQPEGFTQFRPSLAISYTAVPEPGSFALMGLVGLAIGSRRIMRKRLSQPEPVVG
jgi:archaellum component FlaG (FlaF/FlaG flagellin family)